MDESLALPEAMAATMAATSRADDSRILVFQLMADPKAASPRVLVAWSVRDKGGDELARGTVPHVTQPMTAVALAADVAAMIQQRRVHDQHYLRTRFLPHVDHALRMQATTLDQKGALIHVTWLALTEARTAWASGAASHALENLAMAMVTPKEPDVPSTAVLHAVALQRHHDMVTHASLARAHATCVLAWLDGGGAALHPALLSKHLLAPTVTLVEQSAAQLDRYVKRWGDQDGALSTIRATLTTHLAPALARTIDTLRNHPVAEVAHLPGHIRTYLALDVAPFPLVPRQDDAGLVVPAWPLVV